MGKYIFGYHYLKSSNMPGVLYTYNRNEKIARILNDRNLGRELVKALLKRDNDNKHSERVELSIDGEKQSFIVNELGVTGESKNTSE